MRLILDNIADYHNASPTTVQKRKKFIFFWLDILGWSDALEDEHNMQNLVPLNFP